MSEPIEFDPIKTLTYALVQMKARNTEAEIERDYHEGRHPRLDWVQKIKKVFGSQVADQIHQVNYCEKAINAPLSKMAVDGLSDPTAQELYDKNLLKISEPDLYTDAMVVGEGFIFVAEAEDGSDVPYDIVVQRAEWCWVEPGSLRPNDRKWAVVVKPDRDLGEEGGYRAWVLDDMDYFKYVAPVGDPDKVPVPAAGAFEPDPEDPEGAHGFDKVPVVPFKKGRDGRSRLASLRPVQDRIDMLEICKVIAGVFGASRQRVFFTNQDLADGDTESSPDFAIVLDPGNTEDGVASVTEFQHTPLENFDKGIDAEIDRFYEIGDLPKHGRQNPGAGPSGEAVKADDGPFVSMVTSYTTPFEESWRDVFALIGIETDIVWRDPETRNELTQATIVKTLVDAGVPLTTALRMYADFTVDDFAEMAKEKAKQDEAANLAADAARTAAQHDTSIADAIQSGFSTPPDPTA